MGHPLFCLVVAATTKFVLLRYSTLESNSKFREIFTYIVLGRILLYEPLEYGCTSVQSEDGSHT